MTSKFFAVALVSLLLAGCNNGYGITCPTLKKYSDDFQDKAVAEIDVIEKTAPHVVTMFNDYGVTRDAIRKCIELQMADRKKRK